MRESRENPGFPHFACAVVSWRRDRHLNRKECVRRAAPVPGGIRESRYRGRESGEDNLFLPLQRPRWHSLPYGEVIATYAYDAFGNLTGQTGEADNSVLYAGYQYDVETGLYYLNARMYDPVTARFLQADTYAGSQSDPLSLNLYTYCMNNPERYIDQSSYIVSSLRLL